MPKLYNVFFLLILNFNSIHAETLKINNNQDTKSYIDEVSKNLVEQLIENSVETLVGIKVFAWKISNSNKDNKNNKFNFIILDALKKELQKKEEFNVYELESLSSINAKKLMKKMGIKYILKGTYTELIDGIFMSIKILSLKDSRIISSANQYLEKSSYQRITSTRYMERDSIGDGIIRLKSSKR